MMDKKKPPAVEGLCDPQTTASAPDSPQAAGNSQKARSSARFTSFFHLLFYANPTWLDVLLISLGTFAAIAAGVPFPLMGILFGQLVDDINGATCENETAGNADSYRNGVDQKVLQLVYIGIAAFFVVYTYMLCWKIAGQRLVQRLQERYFASLLSQDIEFFDVRQAGELTSQLHGSVQIIQSGTSEKVGIFISTISFFITAYIVGFIKYPQLTGILISLIPAIILSSLISGHFIEKFTNRTAEFNHAASSIASEALSQLAVVQAFGAESRLETKFKGLASTAKKEGVKKSYFAASQAGLLYFFSFSANALAFWKGTAAIAAAYEGAGDNISVGAVYTVVFLIVDACTLLGQVAPLLPMFGSAAAAFRKLEEDMNRQPVTYLDRGDDEPFSLQEPASVEFCDVSFAYPMRPTQTVLDGLSFSCPFGKHTAIIGSSGSGKSTIAALMTRFYEPKAGKIMLAGQDTKELDVRDLRSFISLVQQEAPLFDRSILENIALGLINSPRPEHRRLRKTIMGPELSHLAADVRNGSILVDRAQHYGTDIAKIVELVIDAARSADAFDFIDNLDFGFGTSAGTGGKSLSGGQKQRVALARALVKNPSVLILDEATSSLDAESEHRIRLAIDRICHDRTVISIAHRLSTIKDADNIIVLTPEGIAEQGNHEELLAFKGIYARLTSLQNSSTNFDHSSRQSFETDVDSIKPVDIQTSTDGRPSYDPIPAHESKEVKVNTPQEISNDAAKYSTWKVMRVLLRMMRDRSLWLAAAVVAAFIVGCTYTGSGFIFGYAVGVSSPCNAPSVIASQGRFFAGMFFVLAVVEGLANMLSWSAFGYMAESMLYRMRTRSFHSLLQKSLDWHHSGGRTSSTLLSLITKDCAAIGGLSGSVVGTAFAICVNIVAAIVVSHIVAWKIAVVCIIICPIFLAAGVLQLRVLAKFDKQHADAYAQADSISTGAINSMKAVAALSLEEEVLGTYKRALKAPNKAITKAGATSILWLTLGFSTGNFLYSFAYWWGSTLIIKGEYTPSEFLTALVALLVGSQMWSQLLVLIPEISAALTSSLRVFNTLDIGNESDDATHVLDQNQESLQEKDIEASAESRTLPEGAGSGVSVAFENVSFAYAARVDSMVLHNVSFVVRPGQFCGLVGPSGSGKSTVMNLVQRLYRPTEGTVKINGYDLSRFSGNEFRDDIAVVPQESALFDGSVRFNVGLGARTNRDATDEEIEQACRLANIHETIISLPQGYDTECGPNGMHFSGGQRQRLSIARALVRKPRLLLLDESTSALDAENEEALQKSLQQAARDMTVFVIAHKINTIKAADVIFVLEKGRIENSGTHVDLMETSRTYRAYVEQQMLQG